MTKQATIRGGNVTPKPPVAAQTKPKPKYKPAGPTSPDPPSKAAPTRSSGPKRAELVEKVVQFIKSKNALRRRSHGPNSYGIDTPLGMLIVAIDDGDPPVSLKLTSLEVAKAALGDQISRYTGEWNVGLASIRSYDEMYARIVSKVEMVLGARIVFPKESE